jgi:hypothetical protein
MHPSVNYCSSFSDLNSQSKEVIKGREMEFLMVFSKFTGTLMADDKTCIMGNILNKTSDPILIYFLYQRHGHFYLAPTVAAIYWLYVMRCCK